MVFTIVNAYVDQGDLDLKLSELIYTLESKNFDVNIIKLENINDDNHCNKARKVIESSDFIIYVAPLDSDISRERLSTYLKAYKNEKHPPLFLVLDSNELLSVETVENYIDEFEIFAEDHHTRIVDVKYFKDALEVFKRMANS